MAFFGVLLLLTQAHGQTSAAITGRVTDIRQGSIEGALVVVQATNSPWRLEGHTDARGFFSFASVIPGVYRITVTQRGFGPKEQIRVISVAARVAVNFELAPEGLPGSVTVTAERNAADITRTAREAFFAGQELHQLPINGRDFTRFSLLTPGAISRTNNIADLSFNGFQITQNQFGIDGIDATRIDAPYVANGNERGARLLTGSLDSIAEFRVQTNSYDAQFGRAAGAWVTIASRGGTDEWHGGLIEFFRNDALDARNFFNLKSRQKTPFHYNNFGGHLGGPLRRNRLFVFTNYEGSRHRLGATATGTVLSRVAREQAAQRSPVLEPLVRIIPLGTQSTANPLVDIHTGDGTSAVREDTGSVRVDVPFGTRNTAFARMSVNDSRVLGPQFTNTPAAFGIGDVADVPVRVTNFAISDQHATRRGCVNEFLIGIQKYAARQRLGQRGLPFFTIGGITLQTGLRSASESTYTSFQTSDTFACAVGRQMVRVGVQSWRLHLKRRTDAMSTLSYASVDDFIANRPTSASMTAAQPLAAIESWELAGFVQSTWRAMPTLTLNYGLRYDWFPAPHDPSGNARMFDLAFGALAPPGTEYFMTNTRNFGPRAGVAWQAGMRAIVRAGFGIFYQAFPPGSTLNVASNTVPGSTVLVRAQVPDLAYPFDQFATRGSVSVPTAFGFERDKPDSYGEQWNATLAVTSGRLAGLEAGYVGTRMVHTRRTLNVNLFDPVLMRRPFSGFSTVTLETAGGAGTYHALQTSWRRAIGERWIAVANYTWAHQIDDSGDWALFSSSPQDYRNFRAERGNGSQDVRHSASFAVLFDLPASRRVALNGWQLSTISIVRSGVAQTIVIATNTFGNGNTTNQRPNAVAGVSPYASHQSPNAWYNPAAFSMPLAGTFGNLGRNTVYGPHLVQIDVAVAKETKVSETVRLQLRCEIFNLPNHPNFAQPDNVFGSPTFGAIFSTLGRTLGMGTSRQIQFAAKLLF